MVLTPPIVDLVSSGTRVVVTMEHTAKNGDFKLVEACSLPLTGKRVVDTIITELGVFDVDKAETQLVLQEIAEGVTVEEVKAKTGCKLLISPDLKPMQQ